MSLHPTYTLYDAETGLPYSDARAQPLSTAVAFNRSVTRKLDQITGYHLEFPVGTAFANQLIATAGGGLLDDRSQSQAVLVCSLGQGRGAVRELALLVSLLETPLDPPRIVLEGQDLGEVLIAAGSDHDTYTNCPAYAVLTAPPNGVPITPDTADVRVAIIAPTGGKQTLIGEKGLYQLNNWTLPGHNGTLFSFAVQMPDLLKAIPITVDSYADTLIGATGKIAENLGAQVQNDTAPPGARGHWFADSASRVIRIGYVGEVPTCVLQTAPPADQRLQAQLLRRGLSVRRRRDLLRAQVEVVGGSSDHGMPASGQITGLVLLPGTPGTFSENLPVVGISTGTEGGGVFFAPGDGNLHQIGQSFDCTGLILAGTILYATSKAGAWQHSSSVLDTGVWTRVGGLSGECSLPTASGGTLYVLAGAVKGKGTGSNGAGLDGLFCYPALAGDGSGADHGYAGWSRLLADQLTAYSASGLAVYSVTKADTTTVIYHADASDSGRKGTSFKLPQVGGLDVPIKRLVAGADGTFLLGEAGSSSLWFLPAGQATAGALFNVNGDGSLRDYGDGSPISVNDLVPCGIAINKQRVGLLALTAANGLWWSPLDHGQGWCSAGSQSGLVDQNISYAAFGPVMTVLGRAVQPMACADGASLWQSFTGGVYFSDMLQANLDLGPFWNALWQKAAKVARGFPDHDVTALGTLGDLGAKALGSGGVAVDLPPVVAPFGGLPAHWIWARRLNGRNEFVYRLVNLDSQAPFGMMERRELSEVTTGVAFGAITASQQLALDAYSYLTEASVLQYEVAGTAWYSQDNAALAWLRPGDRVDLDLHAVVADGTPANRDATVLAAIAPDPDRAWYLLEATERDAGNIRQVDLRVATTLNLDTLGLVHRTARLGYQHSRAVRHLAGRRRG